MNRRSFLAALLALPVVGYVASKLGFRTDMGVTKADAQSYLDSLWPPEKLAAWEAERKARLAEMDASISKDQITATDIRSWKRRGKVPEWATRHPEEWEKIKANPDLEAFHLWPIA
jgi:hypothetical protein